MLPTDNGQASQARVHSILSDGCTCHCPVTVAAGAISTATVTSWTATVMRLSTSVAQRFWSTVPPASPSIPIMVRPIPTPM